MERQKNVRQKQNQEEDDGVIRIKVLKSQEKGRKRLREKRSKREKAVNYSVADKKVKIQRKLR